MKQLNWLWEFSKKIVVICSVLYVVGFMFSCVAMWHFQDFTYLGTFIEQSSRILETCVFGYFAKAGIENVIKIKNLKDNSNDETPEVDSEDAVG